MRRTRTRPALSFWAPLRCLPACRCRRFGSTIFPAARDRTVEVKNVVAHRLLAAEFQPAEAPGSEYAPKQALGLHILEAERRTYRSAGCCAPLLPPSSCSQQYSVVRG